MLNVERNALKNGVGFRNFLFREKAMFQALGGQTVRPFADSIPSA